MTPIWFSPVRGFSLQEAQPRREAQRSGSGQTSAEYPPSVPTVVLPGPMPRVNPMGTTGSGTEKLVVQGGADTDTGSLHNVGIDLSGFDARMPKQILNGADIGARL